MLEKMSVKDTADILSHLFGQSKNSIYQDLLKIKNED